MLVGVKKMQTFEEWWSLVHETLDHRDILRATEQAWVAGFIAGQGKAKDFNEQLKERFIDD